MTERSLRLHSTVTELLAYLGVDEEPEVLLDMLESNKGHVTKGNAFPLAEKIALQASKLSQESPNRFLSVFDRLSGLQMRELEPLLYILNKVHSDPTVKAALSRSSESNQNISAPTTPYSKKKSPIGTPYTPGLSKSKSYASLSGSTQLLQTPRVAEILKKQKSQSILQTPLGSTFVNQSQSQSQIQSQPAIESTKIEPFLPEMTEYDFTETLKVDPIAKLSCLKPRDQEALVIEDLLYVLLGMDGEYIKSDYVDSSLDPCLKEIVLQILPIANHKVKIEQFAQQHSSFEYGRVHHAFSAALNEILQEYYILVAQLEHQAHSDPLFSLQRMLFYLQPTLVSFSTICSLISGISAGHKGGLMLSLLSECMVTKSGSGDDIYAKLLEKCAKPYLFMLSQWVRNGVLDDPYEEFMIKEKSSKSKNILRQEFSDIYWDHRYILENDSIPLFLEPFKEHILLTGKYLNVLRECNFDFSNLDNSGASISNIHNGGLHQAFKVLNGQEIVQEIQKGYTMANTSLLKLLRTDLQLVGRLNSIKTFFLLGQSDYLTHFLDLSFDLLNKPVAQVSPLQITSLLELVIRSPSTVSSSDPFKDNLTVEFQNISLFDQLKQINSMVGIDMKKHLLNLRSGRQFDIKESLETTIDEIAGTPSGPLLGVDAFTLGCTFEFPLSLILNSKVINKYQMIFRHLFKCKYLERLLNNSWIDAGKSVSMRVMALRSKMLHFIQQIVYFMFFEVINPHWDEMIIGLTKATTVQDLLKVHDDFLDTCLKECMLTNPKLITLISSLINTCHSFVGLLSSESRQDGFNERLGLIEHGFLVQIQSLIDCVHVLGVAEVGVKLGSLVSQLDYSGYYAGLCPDNRFILNPLAVPTL